MSNNPVGWFEIYVQEMARAKMFYESVFGVQLVKLDSPEIEMWAFPMQAERYGASGALVRMPDFPSGANSAHVRRHTPLDENGYFQSSVLVYFNCTDCAVEAARAASSGGKVEKDKFSIGQYGYISLVIDTEGNRIGLHSRQ